MAKAARAIILENGKILVMRRLKEGSVYYTLVGGRVSEGEDITSAVTREVMEETGLEVTAARYVFYEGHRDPYNEQFIFLCEVAPHDEIKIQEASEEALLNRFATNIHEPLWAEIGSFEKLPFRTPQLQKAIVESIKKGFPAEPVRL
jgi:8-oxo-dGTP diphosphatase